ncbi:MULTISPECIES: MCE family protein [Pseudonocardia]|jgi:phospholipid/cholesterol/gamma-HCH transport system substrate-binding protein|uniref:Phospholipid/cholesterol/gamma-HCH transport system substrate-binding protein n=1 Tax=Pseudonocardia oroxyli TaxID=366584 RepID=A0A1G7GF65_PSEOR|nr:MULTISPECIES: MCE family protein [Pseudonocardia]MCF7553094.1 MCE family protein [Pseudonocardia sp. WMMC193]SDE86764.1 phospholipid/cholesterol/gamma-HCH transport system substrate-binding protein [Pseudonocardia oroxyli]
MTRRPVLLAVVGLVLIAVVAVVAFQAPSLFGGRTYQAEFGEAAGLQSGDRVTVAGVEVGRVTSVELEGDHVAVDFRVDSAWVGDRTAASIEIATLLGSKYLALDVQGDQELDPSVAIPRERTISPFDVVEAFNGLSGTIDQIDTAQLATSLETLSDTFRDTPNDVRGTLDGLSRLSTTISSRDEQIRKLLAGARNLSGILADRRQDFDQLLSDGNLLLGELQKRRDAIDRLLSGTRLLSQQLSGLVADNREQLRPTLETLDRVVAVLQRNQDNLAETLKNEAVFVRLFSNALGNGRWFDNYICGLLPVPTLGPLNPGGC